MIPSSEFYQSAFYSLGVLLTRDPRYL